MKKYISLLLLSVVLLLQVTAQTQKTKFDFKQAESVIATLDTRAEDMKQRIRHTETSITVSRKTYYVSAEGNDDNNGLSPDEPVKSLDKVNSLDLKEGDAVLFNRGDLWRGSIKSKKGVSYSAYGKGEKPRIYGSPCNAAEVGEWKETETPNVYVFSMDLPSDVGTLVFDEGKSCAVKVMKDKREDGTTLHIDTKEPFSSFRDLKRDLEFYHDYMDTKRIYLYSSEGNPARRFKSIELLVRTNIIYAVDEVVVDNLCLKYCGAHGIGSGTVTGLTVTNCELGWIGGSIQAEDIFGRTHPTRFGNAIEIYGGCGRFLVDNCYVFQVYDAGITHQFSSGGTQYVVMKDVVYSNNLIEDCVYSIEYFLGKSENDAERYMDNVKMTNNLMRRSGFGWGKQRPDKGTPAHIKSWSHYNRASNFIVENNVFDRGTVELLNIEADEKEWLPVLRNNTYIQYIDVPLGRIGSEKVVYPFNESIKVTLKKILGEKNPRILYVKPLKE